MGGEMSEIVDVWILHREGAACVFQRPEDVLDDIHAAIAELCDGQEIEARIVKSQMTESQLEALPDFEGY